MISLGILSTLARFGVAYLGIHLSILLNNTGNQAIFGASSNEYYTLQVILAFFFEIFEAVFLVSTSFLFMIHISTLLPVRKTHKEILKMIFIEHDGFRFILIMILNFLVASFAIVILVNKGSHTSASHSALYIPCWIYSVSLYTFLKSSFISPKLILKESEVAKFSESKDLREDHGSYQALYKNAYPGIYNSN